MKIYFLLYNRIDAFSNAWNAPKTLKYQALVWFNMLITANIYSVLYPIYYYAFLNKNKHINFLISFTILFLILLIFNFLIFYKNKKYQQFINNRLPVYNLRRINIIVILYVFLTVALLTFGMKYVTKGHL